jgi:hypothetical protein
VPAKPQAHANAATKNKQQNKHMKTIITTLSLLAIATTLSIAQEKPPGGPGGSGGPGQGQRPNPEEIFKKLDANSDGAVSLDEFKASKRAQQDPAKAEAAFKSMDKNADGQVSLEEFKANRPQGGPGQGGQGKGGKGGKGGQGGQGQGA